MSEVEELEAEIAELLKKKREKLKAELEKEAEEERKKEEEAARKSHEEALRATIKEELKKEMNTSKIIKDDGDGDDDGNGGEESLQEFAEIFRKKHGIEYNGYEDMIKKLAYGEYKR